MAGCGAAKDDRPISGGGGASPGGCGGRGGEAVDGRGLRESAGVD
jgi:hypothetical protein